MDLTNYKENNNVKNHPLCTIKHATRPLAALTGLTLALTLGGCASSPERGATGQSGSEQTQRQWREQAHIDYGLLPAKSGPDRSRTGGDSAQGDNLWGYIASRFTLEVPSHPRIDQERAFYASHPDYLELVSRRAAPYLHLIVQQLEENDLPLELTLLPIVESAYRPEALSRSQAAGIWQFIPSTGTYMGLDQNPWYDGRRDIMASTDAAVRYFNRLRNMFDDDWPVIIAAYNGGEGTLSRAIAANESRGRPTDFWHLEVRQETAYYPARFYALVEIFSQPEKYGFNPQSTPLTPMVTHVEFDQPLHLGRLAQLTGIEKEDFVLLNPGYSRLITGPETRGLLVPHDQAHLFTEDVLAQARESVSNWMHYRVQRGDSLTGIARRFGATVAELREVNMLDDAVARAGMDLLVPRNRPGSVMDLASQEAAGAQVHRVAAGDSLWAIARRYNTSVNELQALNGLDANQTLRVGDRLVVRAAPTTTARAVQAGQHASGMATYVVQSGDTLWGVARRFSVTIDELRDWNGLDANGHLRPGQVLNVASNERGA